MTRNSVVQAPEFIYISPASIASGEGKAHLKTKCAGKTLVLFQQYAFLLRGECVCFVRVLFCILLPVCFEKDRLPGCYIILDSES